MSLYFPVQHGGDELTRDQRARQREHDDACDEWNAAIDTARGLIEKCMADVAAQAKGHQAGGAEWESTLGLLDDAISDLPRTRA